MFELSLRSVLATVLLVVAGATKSPPFEIAWKVAAFFAAYSFLAYALERRDLRNAGVSAIIAVFDSALVALVVSAAGKIELFGFLTLLPPAWAVARHGADPLAMAPIVASFLLMGANLFGGHGWTPVLLGQVGGVLIIGLLGSRRGQIVSIREIVQLEGHSGLDEDTAQEYMSLREKFRALRDHAGDLERRSRKDKLASQISEAVGQEPDNALAALAQRLHESLRVEGLTLYALLPDSKRFVAQSVSGDVPVEAKDASFVMPDFRGEWQLQERLGGMVRSLSSAGEAVDSAAVVLKDRGRIVGMVALFDRAKDRLAAAADVATEISETVARFIVQIRSREDEKARLKQAEFMYMVASTTQGAGSATAMATRIAREAWESLSLDHLAVFFLEGDEPLLVTNHGANLAVIESLRFAIGKGLNGWTAMGSPEVYLADARDDTMLSREEALKRRIGSFILLPLYRAGDVFGFFTAASHRSNGVDSLSVETLRLAVAELSLALGRISQDLEVSAGLATPAEFRDAVSKAGSGHMVYLEVLRREELTEAHGKAAVEHGLRRLAVRLRALLPPDGILTRRMEGDFVAFLRIDDSQAAQAWATSASATASMVALTTPDGKHRLPLGLRSKVAAYSPQTDQISRTLAS